MLKSRGTTFAAPSIFSRAASEWANFSGVQRVIGFGAQSAGEWLDHAVTNSLSGHVYRRASCADLFDMPHGGALVCAIWLQLAHDTWPWNRLVQGLASGFVLYAFDREPPNHLGGVMRLVILAARGFLRAYVQRLLDASMAFNCAWTLIGSRPGTVP